MAMNMDTETMRCERASRRAVPAGKGRVRLGSIAAIALLCLGGLVGAQGGAQKKASLLPERFLREYDTVTLTLDKDTGPAKGGPGDDASSILSISPAHPGEYRWLDARTLQFLPSEPWPPPAHL
jgi:hypothetical protein